jgi:hypothetical protein
MHDSKDHIPHLIKFNHALSYLNRQISSLQIPFKKCIIIVMTIISMIWVKGHP